MTPASTSTPQEISAPIQLLVEGGDDAGVTAGMIKHLKLEGLQIRRMDGIANLRLAIGAVRNMPGFFEKVKVLGVIRDADNDASAAVESVHNALRDAEMPAPKRAGEIASGSDTPSTAICILPGGAENGTLETVCLRAVRRPDVLRCVDQFLACAGQNGVSVKNKEKAKIGSYIAIHGDTPRRLGEAATPDYIDWDHAAFEPLRRFLLDIQTESKRLDSPPPEG